MWNDIKPDKETNAIPHKYKFGNINLKKPKI